MAGARGARAVETISGIRAGQTRHHRDIRLASIAADGDAGERWFVALCTAIASLANLPSRCPLAPENQDSPVELRQLLYGRRPHVYRVLFAIEGDIVQILHIHAQMSRRCISAMIGLRDWCREVCDVGHSHIRQRPIAEKLGCRLHESLERSAAAQLDGRGSSRQSCRHKSELESTSNYRGQALPYVPPTP